MTDLKDSATDQDLKVVVEETKHSNDRNSIDATYSYTSRSTIPDSSLPSFQKDLPYCVSVHTIINTFNKSCQRLKFLITEQTPTACTAYHTQRCSMKSLVSCCLGKKTRLRLTSVRMIINTNSRQQSRVVYIKGQFGDTKLIGKVITAFAKLIDSDLVQSSELKYQQVEEEEEIAVTCKNESYSYYQIYKTLSCENYSLGKGISEFCESFVSHYRNPIESAQLLPQPLMSIQATVEHTIETLFTHYNYGKKSTEKVMAYCRPAVEKYIYSKLYNNLMDIYKAKYAEDDRILESIRGKISKMSIEETMQYLDVPELLWVIENCNPYEEAIENLDKLNDFVTPTEKLTCIMSFDAVLKTTINDYLKNQSEPDDSLTTLTMFSLLKSKSNTLHSEFAFLNDYLKEKPEEDKSVLLNLEKALMLLMK